ncbi:winged helix-turn-helix transcriptional regulator [Enterococcus hirae]|uniref:MarR family winged helix-turn-helix transcriptional regulator n=1 Tax=Enterococcus hirae TaxID=1354 RepID=UPI001A96D2E3|nr:MarR family winged helix-turn-helix transcriptional regulator [Enterococcus hirae]MBO1099800.1 winged helix-turn-helix transcriptional regulator [Enterococcus hirae]
MNTTDILEKLLYLTQQPSMVYMNHVEVKNDPIFETMKLLQITDKSTPGKIAQSLNIPSCIISQIIKNLELVGSVQRVKDPNDARSTFIQLTAQGKQSMEQHEMFSLMIRNKLFCGFTEEELKLFNEYLLRVEKNTTEKTFIESVSTIYSNDKNWECFGRISVKLSKLCKRTLSLVIQQKID